MSLKLVTHKSLMNTSVGFILNCPFKLIQTMLTMLSMFNLTRSTYPGICIDQKDLLDSFEPTLLTVIQVTTELSLDQTSGSKGRRVRTEVR